jgi:hypothetical protein
METIIYIAIALIVAQAVIILLGYLRTKRD